MRYSGGRYVTFLSQPKRFVFLVGREIQPCNLESSSRRTKQEDVNTKRTAFNHVNHFQKNTLTFWNGGISFKQTLITSRRNGSSLKRKGKWQKAPRNIKSLIKKTKFSSTQRGRCLVRKNKLKWADFFLLFSTHFTNFHFFQRNKLDQKGPASRCEYLMYVCSEHYKGLKHSRDSDKSKE